MSSYFVKSFLVCVSLFVGLFLWCEVAPAKNGGAMMLFPSTGSKKTQDKADKALPDIPADLDHAKINEILAGLSDDQVRHLLLRELERSAAASAKKEEPKKVSGLAKIAQEAEENITLFNKRLRDIQSGAVAVPEFLPQTYADLRGKGGISNILLMFAAILALLVAGLGAEWLFGRYTAGIRQRLIASPPAHWTVKIKRLGLCAMIEFMSLFVFAAATLIVFFLFFNRGPFARLVLMIYLVIVLAVRGIGLVSHFFFAPKTPALRCLAIMDETARTVHRWLMIFAGVLGAGFLLRGLLELQGVSEEIIIFIRATNGAVVLVMIVYLLFYNREAVARLICSGPGDRAAGINLFRTQLAAFWHLLALPYVLLIWGLWVFYLLVERADLVIPLLALLSSIPLFLILDWLGQKLLTAVFGLMDKPEAPAPAPALESEPAAPDDESTAASTAPKCAPAGPVDVGRFIPILRRCLSLALAGVIFFWLLQLWGFEVGIGEQVTGGAVKVLLIVTLAYVGWRLIEDAINRKLKEVQGGGEVDEDSEAGGTGGSRVGTLLLLFRKFLLVVLLVTVGLIILSAVGINITPLLAGAGILGLAIGLGTQNLIKDIVSGLFFLLDDAFRINDYIESGAKVKGTIEAIGIRSLKLRHTRGMVINVPFSQLATVVNFSRDYNITKLDFRVPFDTDVDAIRKIIKKIDKEIQADEEMGPNLLGPIKSAGVLALDDAGLIMRVKFKTKPGVQFVIQRQVFRRLKELFKEKGIEFATRDVVVRLPDEPTSGKQGAEGEAPSPDKTSAKRGGLSAAAGAAIGAALAEEEAKRKLLEQGGESG